MAHISNKFPSQCKDIFFHIICWRSSHTNYSKKNIKQLDVCIKIRTDMYFFQIMGKRGLQRKLHTDKGPFQKWHEAVRWKRPPTPRSDFSCPRANRNNSPGMPGSRRMLGCRPASSPLEGASFHFHLNRSSRRLASMRYVEIPRPLCGGGRHRVTDTRIRRSKLESPSILPGEVKRTYGSTHSQEGKETPSRNDRGASSLYMPSQSTQCSGGGRGRHPNAV